MADIYTAYFYRMPNTIDAVFTIQKYDPDHPDKQPVKIFDRLPARSGQYSHRNTSWVRGKSPIPKGDFYLWTKPVQPGAYDVHGRAIGQFHPISSSPTNHRLIKHPTDPTLERWDVGAHPENDYPGSAGCTVLLHNTEERYKTMVSMLQWLEKYNDVAPWIKLISR